MFGGLTLQLSAQHIIECIGINQGNKTYNGCTGGYLEMGFGFMELYGVTSNFRYPFTLMNSTKSGECQMLTDG